MDYNASPSITPVTSAISAKYRRAIGAPAKALLVGISVALLATVAHAAGDSRFVLAAYSNVAGGQEILSGDYKAAMIALDTRSVEGAFDAASANLNRCVALTMQKRWPAAQTACDTAVRYAKLAKLTQDETGLQALHTQDEKLALAYSDRAVLEWLTANGKAASKDLKRAQSLLPSSKLLAQNATALGERGTVVNVRSADQR